MKPTYSPNISCVSLINIITSPKEPILNIVMFVPMGFFIPLLYKGYTSCSKTALIAFTYSLSIELIQMFGLGSTDVNDLITNTLGACLGLYIQINFLKVI